MTINRKRTTTVALDYGLMKLDAGERIHLYGTPGQERFDFMWDILTKGGLGVVLRLALRVWIWISHQAWLTIIVNWVNLALNHPSLKWMHVNATI